MTLVLAVALLTAQTPDSVITSARPNSAVLLEAIQPPPDPVGPLDPIDVRLRALEARLDDARGWVQVPLTVMASILAIFGLVATIFVGIIPFFNRRRSQAEMEAVKKELSGMRESIQAARDRSEDALRRAGEVMEKADRSLAETVEWIREAHGRADRDLERLTKTADGCQNTMVADVEGLRTTLEQARKEFEETVVTLVSDARAKFDEQVAEGHRILQQTRSKAEEAIGEFVMQRSVVMDTATEVKGILAAQRESAVPAYVAKDLAPGTIGGLIARRDLSEAERRLNAALRASPNDPSLLFHLARFRSAISDTLERTLQAVDAAEKNGHPVAECNSFKAKVMRNAGRNNEALEAVTKALGLMPADVSLVLLKSDILKDLQGAHAAAEFLSEHRRLRRELTTNYGILLLEAELRLTSDHPDDRKKARGLLSQAQATNPNDPRISVEARRLLSEATGEFDESGQADGDALGTSGLLTPEAEAYTLSQAARRHLNQGEYAEALAVTVESIRRHRHPNSQLMLSETLLVLKQTQLASLALRNTPLAALRDDYLRARRAVLTIILTSLGVSDDPDVDSAKDALTQIAQVHGWNYVVTQMVTLPTRTLLSVTGGADGLPAAMGKMEYAQGDVQDKDLVKVRELLRGGGAVDGSDEAVRGLLAIAQGDADGARTWLRKAAIAGYRSAYVQFNMAMACALDNTDAKKHMDRLNESEAGGPMTINIRALRELIRAASGEQVEVGDVQDALAVYPGYDFGISPLRYLKKGLEQLGKLTTNVAEVFTLLEHGWQLE